jgi:hypothetical protein
MIAIVKALLAVIPSPFQSRSALHVEILVRPPGSPQLIVERRSA